MLARGAEIEAKDSNKLTPLHKAAWGGHGAAIGLLLDQGADIEARDSECQTPLHIDTRRGYEVAVRLLNRKGEGL